MSGAQQSALSAGGVEGQSDKRRTVACVFFRKGSCRNGDSCPFLHESKPEAGTAEAPAIPAKMPAPRHIVVELKPGVPYMALDVECVATAIQHNARATAQIALVSQSEECVLNVYVKPAEPVVSYLEPLTSLSKKLLDEHGLPLATAMARLRERLPKDAVLVGMNIAKDVEWLQLKEGVDFGSMIDLAALFRVWNESFTYFGQDHVAACWLGVANDGAAHNAVTDAIKSMQLFNMYCRVESDAAQLEGLQRRLVTTPIAPSFAKRFPTLDSCCMGNRKTCTCGAPFFS